MSVSKVLVVDDDPIIRDTIRIILRRAGYEVLTAATGQEAIALMDNPTNAGTVCTLLCDLDMPGMSGIELINYFHACYPNIPITVLSGTDASEFFEGITNQGVTDWLRKPASPEAVLGKVRVSVRLYDLRTRA